MEKRFSTALALVLIAVVLCTPVEAQDDSDLAQDLTNPVADLLTIPIQMNYDQNFGPADDGWKLQTNIQPVLPFNVNDDWNLITRTIMPVIWQDEIVPGAGSQFGLGDINLSLFFSPKKPTNGVIWGVGPVLYLSTATDELLGAEKWGAGPTAIALTMRGRWTMGALANHVWSFAGSDDRDDLNSTFVQPFVAYTTPSAWTYWSTSGWSVPINVAVARLVMMGRLPVSLQAGLGRWLKSPDTGPDGWRFRVQANFVLPKP
jgi:hypothetical protein